MRMFLCFATLRGYIHNFLVLTIRTEVVVASRNPTSILDPFGVG